MHRKSATVLSRSLTLSGLLLFIIHRHPISPLPIAALLLAVFIIWRAQRDRSNADAVLIPFAGGWLIPLMKLFYWDRWDFALRIDLLFGLAFVFSLLLATRRFQLAEKMAARFNRLHLKKRLLLIFVCSEICFVAASLVITTKGVKLVGDEPHYLAIAQSLAQDFDLNVFNQYYRDKYREFLEVKQLPAHGTFGKGYKRIYSYHLPGLAVSVAPFFFFKIRAPLLYVLIRSYLGLFGAMLAALIYLFALKIKFSPNRALFAALAFTFTVPIFFYSFHLFPEIQALLLLTAALYWLLFPGARPNLKTFLAGLFLGLTVFWGIKYSLFIYLYGLGFLVYFVRRRQYRRAILLVTFPLLCQLLFFLYLYHAYGNFSPSSVYRGMLDARQQKEFMDIVLRQIPLRLRLETLLDYFFDQRDGLLLYSPLYFFALPGLVLAIKNIKRYFIWLLLSLPALAFILNHAFSTIRAGYCPQARYLAPAAGILMLLAMIYHQETNNRWGRELFACIPLYSLLVVVYQLLQPATLYQPTTHDSLIRAGLMFQQWSNLRISLPALLPSFIKTNNSGYLPNLIIPGLAVLGLLFLLIPLKKASARWLLTPTFLAAFALLSLFPRPGLDQPRLVSAAGQMPYFQFPANGTPFAANGNSIVLNKGGDHHLVVGTLKKTASFVLEWKNPTSGSRSELEIFLFDQPAGRIVLQPGSAGRSELPAAPGYRHRNLFLYQFHFRLSATEPDLKTGLELNLVPGKNPAFGLPEDSSRGF